MIFDEKIVSIKNLQKLLSRGDGKAITVNDLARVFDSVKWSYGFSQDRSRLITRFDDNWKPVLLSLYIQNNSIVVEAVDIEKLSVEEMAMVLKITGKPPPNFFWARDPYDNGVWARIILNPPSKNLSNDWLVQNIDEIMLTINDFHEAVPKMRARLDP